MTSRNGLKTGNCSAQNSHHGRCEPFRFSPSPRVLREASLPWVPSDSISGSAFAFHLESTNARATRRTGPALLLHLLVFSLALHAINASLTLTSSHVHVRALFGADCRRGDRSERREPAADAGAPAARRRSGQSRSASLKILIEVGFSCAVGCFQNVFPSCLLPDLHRLVACYTYALLTRILLKHGSFRGRGRMVIC